MKTFYIKKSMVYRELEVKDAYIDKFYWMENPHHEAITSIPDGCIDLQFVWQQSQRKVYLCGSLLEGKVTRTSSYDRCFGIKFNLGIIPDMEQLDMKALIGQHCELTLTPQRSAFMLFMEQHQDFMEYVQFFRRHFDTMKYAASHEMIRYIFQEMEKSNGSMRIDALSDKTGYSRCYTDRVFKHLMGMSIKKYACIIRFQSALEQLNNNEETGWDGLGYYDQAHFINEFKKYTSYTPRQYQSHLDERIMV